MYIYYETTDGKNSDAERKIVRDLRNVIWIADANGKTQKYSLNTPQKKVMPKKKSVPKKTVQNKPKMCDEAATLPKCWVNVLNLSEAEIQKEIAKVKRDGMVRDLEAKVREISRKNRYYLNNMFLYKKFDYISIISVYSLQW